jgi:transposase
MSKRAVAGFVGDLLGVEISVGSVTSCEVATSIALAAPVEEARAYVQQQPIVNADETGWREGRKKAWLWAAVTPLVAVFLICRGRGQDAAKKLLGFFQGVLITDQWNGYHYWSVAKRQLCWAHLKRHFTELAEFKGAAGRIGEALLAQTQKMFGWWYRVRDGTMRRSTFQCYMGPLRRSVEGLLQQGATSRNRRTVGMCAELLKRAQALWTFVRIEGVEPTNNAAERAIRPCVLWRKGSFGTHSAEGSRFVERIMTVRTTLRLQSRNVLDFVIAACEAKLHGRRPPSLLPHATLGRAAARAS